MNSVKENGNAITKGHILSDDDLLIRQCILEISCKGELNADLLTKVADPFIMETLVEMEKEGILYLMDGGLRVTGAGEMFIRNICRVFDRRVGENGREVFSRAI
jgi:oxygen-independent coproporphyrinogen-3 oxidase